MNFITLANILLELGKNVKFVDPKELLNLAIIVSKICLKNDHIDGIPISVGSPGR